MATTHEDIARFKTQAWQSAIGLGDYQGRIYADKFNITLKNLTEIGVAVEHARGKVLDAGAGTGRFTIPLHDAGFDVTGLDVSAEMLDIARQAAGARDIPWQQGSIFDLPYAVGSFDTVVSITVINHFPQWRDILREYVRVLRPGGRLVFNLRSRPHVAYANRGGVRFGFPANAHNPAHFMAEVDAADAVEALTALGARVVRLAPYEIFNSNFVLDAALGAAWPAAVEALEQAFRAPGALELWAFLERELAPYLPLEVSYGFMVVADLGPGPTWQPPALVPHEGMLDAKAIAAAMGPAYPAFAEALARRVDPPGALSLLLALDALLGQHMPVPVDWLSLLGEADRARALDQVAWRWTGEVASAAHAGGDALVPLMTYTLYERLVSALKPMARVDG